MSECVSGSVRYWTLIHIHNYSTIQLNSRRTWPSRVMRVVMCVMLIDDDT